MRSQTLGLRRSFTIWTGLWCPNLLSHLKWQHISIVSAKEKPARRFASQYQVNRADEGASIIAIADTFDRLISPQRYRRPLNENDALKILKHDAEGTADEPIVEAFTRVYVRESQNSKRKAA